MKSSSTWKAPLAFAMALGGCASVTIPPERLEHDQSSIRAAEELGANTVPEAKLHVQLAKDETAAAQKLAADGDERALQLLARANADADLAVAMTNQAAVHSQELAAEEDLKKVEARSPVRSAAPSPAKDAP